jgi:nitrate/TMAO reductase-like tetraheme cytochrome c subunit
LLVLAVCVGGLLTLLTARQAGSDDRLPPDRPIVEARLETPTSATCRSCHPGEFGSWHASFHRTMTQEARRANVAPDMDGLELELEGTIYRVDLEGDSYVVRTRPNRGSSAAGGAWSAPREIVLTTGSHHQQNYWLTTGEGRTVEAFPFGWLIADQRWAPVGDTFLNPPGLKTSRVIGGWNNGCINCHSTHGVPGYLDGAEFDTRVQEFGIACASCHGDAAEHVRKHRDPWTRYAARIFDGDAGDPTIANPARMSGPESALACGQCHSIWAFESVEAAVRWNREGGDFRPGEPDLGERFVVQPTEGASNERIRRLSEANPHFLEDSYWGDGMVRVTGREYNGVAASPCFKGNQFSCLSCHEMHPAKTDPATILEWRVSQMSPGGREDRACLQCHESIGADIPAHTKHAVGSAGSRCYDCHMPHTGFGLMRAVRSHQVTSPTVRESLDHGRPNACNLCHLDKPLGWTADTLRDWFGHERPSLPADDERISAAAKWLLSGDAGQRGIVAWAMGWKPAQEASGTEWLAPYLAVTLNDPYSAVRYVAWKSLLTLPGFADFAFDYTAPDDATFDAAQRAYGQAMRRRRPGDPAPPPATLIDRSGRFFPSDYDRLLDQRDNRPIFLVE